MELKRETKTGLDISAEAEVLSYTYTGASPIEVIARIDLGSGANVLSGVGGLYLANMYLDTVGVTPLGEIVVPAGRTRTIIISKLVPLEPGDAVSIRVLGLPGDVSVNTISSLRDATPAKAEDILGSGAVMVDHNFGSTDALQAVTPGGVGVNDVDINAFLTSDYAANRRTSQYVAARTTTGPDGRWARAMMLDPGSYTLVYYKQGQYGPNTIAITVA